MRRGRDWLLPHCKTTIGALSVLPRIYLSKILEFSGGEFVVAFCWIIHILSLTELWIPKPNAKMPSKSSGRIVKANRHKILGSHNRNHRWETFTSKISKFNSLHPLRKVRRHDLETEDLSATTSYFQTGLQKWGELNVSTPFVSFKREVLPLSESLPQILHFEKRIMELLAKYISMQDKEALEPLLDLLTAFAHDLGMRFEKYYGQSLTLIVAIAGRPQPVEVIEWTFGALAFLFKYLSKLLVPNLRPTFDAVSPLMGKARHPPHIARFAAEALSFLVKKAGAPSHRETSLPLFVRHVKSDLLAMSEDRQFMLYKDGVMTMFAEAIKGNEYTVHSAGQAIVPVLMDASLDDQNNEEEKDSTGSGGIWVDVVCGVLTSTVHHTTPDTFEELCETILEKMNEIHEQRLKNNDWHHAQLLIRVLGVLSGVRRGNRVRNWPVVIQRLVAVLGQLASLKEDELKLEDDTIWNDILVNVAIIWHHAPVESLILQLQPLTLALTKGPMMRWFIPFCSYCCDLDATRFGRLLRNEFQKYVCRI
jgi:U3 small nucleolar RNA-associated protein 20